MEEEKLKRKKERALITSNRRQFADACNDLATYYAKYQRYSDALDEYELQASICDELGLQMKWAACQRMIGEMYLLMADFDKAMKHVRHHWDIAKKLNNLIEEVKAMETIGRIHLVQGQTFSNKERFKTSLKAAEKFFMESLALCESRRSKTSQHDLMNIQAKILLNVGDVQEHLGFFDKAIDYIGKAITICLREGLDDVLHNCYTTEASMHSNKKDYAKALSCLDRALEVANRTKDQVPKTCEALALKADILCKMSDYQGARQVLLQAWKLKTPDEMEHKNIESNLKVVVAMCETEDMVKSSNPYDNVSYKNLYEKLGDGACRLKNYAGAVECYLKMLDHAVVGGDCGKTLAPIYVSLYQTYKDMGCYNEALAYCNKEYDLIKDEPKEAVTTLYNIAEILFLANNPYPVVEKACIDARNAAKKWNPKKYETKVLKSLLKYQMKYGETDKMEETKAELCALGYKDFDNLENSEDAAGDDADTTHVGDDVRLEGLPGGSDTNDHEVADEAKPREQEQSEETNNVNITKNLNGETLLHRACMSGNKNKVESLLAKGHPVNIRDNEGWLPLHDACVHGRLEIVDFLINSGADVNASSYCNGKTPLHVAARKGHFGVVQLLLDKGAIPSVKDELNKTPLDELQNWRILQYRVTKEKETIYKHICNKIKNLIKNTTGVDYEISESKPRVKPLKDISQPSTSKSSNNIQDFILIYDSDEEIIKSPNNKNQSPLTSNNTNINRVTEPVVKSSNIKKEIQWWSSNDVEVNENISVNFQDNEYVCSKVIGDESMLKTSGEMTDSLYEKARMEDFVRSSKNQELVIICDSDDEIVDLQNNRNQLAPSLNGINVKQAPEIVLESNIKQGMEWCNSNNVDVNENISDNFQDSKNLCCDDIVYKSMLDISRQLIYSVSKNTTSADFVTSESEIPVGPINDQSLPINSKTSGKNQEFAIVYKSDDELVESQNTREDDLGVNKENNEKRKRSKPLLNGNNTKKKTNLPIKNKVKESNNIQDKNTCSVVIAAESMMNTNKKANKSLIEYTGGIDFDPVNSKKDRALPSTSKISKDDDDFLIFDDSIDSDEFPVVDVKKSITPIKNISPSNNSKINSNIQALQNNKDQSAILSDDLVTSVAQSSHHETVISGVNEYTSEVPVSINITAGENPEDEVNKSVPALLTPNAVLNDRLDDDLSINKSKKRRKHSDPFNIVANRHKNSVENVDTVTKPLVENNKNTKRKKTRYSENVDINENSSNSDDFQDNENVCSEGVAAESILNTSREINGSLSESGIDFDTSESNSPFKPIKDISQPTTSNMSSNIQNENWTSFLSNEIESSNGHSINRNACDFSDHEVRKSIPAFLTPSKESHDKLHDDLDINQHNENMKKRKLSDPFTVVAKKRLLNSRKYSIEKLNTIIEPLTESQNNTKQNKTQVSDDIDLNKNTNSHNFQGSENNRSKVIAAISMLNISGELNDSLIESGVDFDTSESNTSMKPIKHISQPSTTNMSGDTQKEKLRTVPSNEIESSVEHSSNHETKTPCVKEHITALSTSINRNASPSIPEDELRPRDYVDVNKKSSNSDNFQGSEYVCAKAIASESMTIINKALIEATGGVDFDTPVPKILVNPIKDIFPPSSPEISSFVQESQTNKSQTAFSPEDFNHPLVCREPEISSVKAYSSATLTLTNIHASECPKVDIIKSVSTFSTPNKVNNFKLDNDLAINKQNNEKKKDKEMKNKGKLNESLPGVKKKLSSENHINRIENINSVTEPLVKSKTSTECIVNSSRELNNSLIECNGDVDFDTSEPKTPVNVINDIDLPSTSEISNYIQETQNNKNQTPFPSEDEEILNDQSVNHKTEIFNYKAHRSALSALTRKASKKKDKEKKTRSKRRQTPKRIFARSSSSDNNHIPNNGFDAVKSINPSNKQEANTIQPMNLAQPSNNCPMQTQTVPPATVKVYIGDGVLLISLDLDTINTLTISWLVEEVRSIYYKLNGTTPVFILMTCDGAILSEDDPLSLVLSSPELKACFTNCEVSSKEALYLESRYAADIYDELTRDITDDVLILPHDGSLQSTLPHADPDKLLLPTSLSRKHEASPQPASPRPESPQPSSLCPKHEISSQRRSSLSESSLTSSLSHKHETSPQPAAPLPESPQPSSMCPKHEKLSQPWSPLSESPQTSSLCPKHEISSQPRSSLSESSLTSSLRLKHESSPQPRSPRPQSPRPGCLAQPTSPGCGFAGPALPSKCMPRPGSPIDPHDPVISSQSVLLDEQELDDDILQLLGDAPGTEIRLGPPVHKAVAKRWQEILAKGLQKDVADQIMEVYSVPANCDLLLAPTLNPEVKATIREDKANRDSSLMEQQKQLGLAISALGTAVNSILLNETSKHMLLKPISDACRLLCDIHFRETETRRHDVITSTHPELQDSLANTVRDNHLFGDNVMEKIKTVNNIQQSGETVSNLPKSEFGLSNIVENE